MSLKEDLLPILRKKFIISNELGLHARPAAQLVKIANRYKSNIILYKDDREVNGKSIMGILMLAAPKGSEIEIAAEGDDAEAAVHELGDLIDNKFGER